MGSISEETPYTIGLTFASQESLRLLYVVLVLVLAVFYITRLAFTFMRVEGDIFVVRGISSFVCFKYRGQVYTVSHAWVPLYFCLDRVYRNWEFRNYGLDVLCTSKPEFESVYAGQHVVCKMVINCVITPRKGVVRIVTHKGKNYYAAAFGLYYGSSGSPIYCDHMLVGVYGYNVLVDGEWCAILSPVAEIDHEIAYDFNGVGILQAATGSGKTSTMIGIIKASSGKKFLILSPTVFLLEQMVQRLKESRVEPTYQTYKDSSNQYGWQAGNANVVVSTAYGIDLERYRGWRIYVDEWDYPSAEYMNVMRKLKSSNFNYLAFSATSYKQNRIFYDPLVPFNRIKVGEVSQILYNARKGGDSVLIIHHTPSMLSALIEEYAMHIITSKNSSDFDMYPLWRRKEKVTERHGKFVITTPIARRGIAVNFDIVIDYGMDVVIHIDQYIERKLVPSSWATIQQSYGRLAGRRPGRYYLIDTNLTLQLRCTDELMLAYYEHLDGIYRFLQYDFSLFSRLKSQVPPLNAHTVLLLVMHDSKQADVELQKLGVELNSKSQRDEPLSFEPVSLYTGKARYAYVVNGYPLDIVRTTSSYLILVFFLCFEVVFRFCFGNVRVAKTSKMPFHYALDLVMLVVCVVLDIYHTKPLLFGVGYTLSIFFTTSFAFSRVALYVKDRFVSKLSEKRAGDIIVNDIVVYALDPILISFIVPLVPIIVGVSMVFALLLGKYYADLLDISSGFYKFVACELRELKVYAPPDERTRRLEEIEASFYKQIVDPRAWFISMYGHKYRNLIDIENQGQIAKCETNFRVYSTFMIFSNVLLGAPGSALLYVYIIFTTLPILYRYKEAVVANTPTTIREWYYRYPAEWLLVIHPMIGFVYNNREFYLWFTLHE